MNKCHEIRNKLLLLCLVRYNGESRDRDTKSVNNEMVWEVGEVHDVVMWCTYLEIRGIAW